MKINRLGLIPVFLFALFFCLIASPSFAHDKVPHESSMKRHHLKELLNLWKLLQKHHINHPLSDKKLFYGIMKGLAGGTGDPNTSFFTPTEYKDYLRSMNGDFVGIGIYVGVKKSWVTIISSMPGSPAEKAGIQSGDIIYKVDGEKTQGMSVENVAVLIRGKKGAKVILTIVREGVDEPFDVEIIRDKVVIPVGEWKIRKDKIGYIKLYEFADKTDVFMDKVIRDFTKNKVKGIILDLRGNPGGYMHAARNVCSRWLSFMETFVAVQFAHGKKREKWSLGVEVLRKFPTVVLINKGSASASEVVAGAFQDYKIATIVGTQSYGKGSVQQFFELQGGAAIKITIARWFTPKGRLIEGKGITPDIVVEITKEDKKNKRDPQLERAVKEINSMIIKRAPKKTTKKSPAKKK